MTLTGREIGAPVDTTPSVGASVGASVGESVSATVLATQRAKKRERTAAKDFIVARL